ncbi:MAG: M20 family metallo-hydrolase [Saprospiraceae bacterium]
MQNVKVDARPYIQLLQQLISTQSFSREEEGTAQVLADFFAKNDISVERKGNNVWAKNLYFNESRPTVLLNSHHDTVKPVAGWQRDPFSPDIENGVLYGLGSNDAGASLVSLIATFVHFYEKENLPFNLIIAATAEEEISGKNGIASILEDLGKIHVGIVGEPTQMRMAIAEKGLMVVDGIAHGKAGHAAREEGINSIYIAIQDIEWIKNYDFTKVSSVLGKTKMTVTQVNAGTQHNVVPDACKFVIDVRTNEEYSNQEVFEILKANLQSEVKARSFRLNSSKIGLEHPLVKYGLEMKRAYYGSPTLSDQALMPFTTLKMGVGKSERSHTADEFILISEIEEGIEIYINLLTKYAGVQTFLSVK